MCFIRAMITSFARALTDRYYGVAIVIERKFRVTVLVSYVNACLRAPFRAVCPIFLLDLHSVFLGNFIQLFASELLWRCSRSAGYFTNERLDSRWCHNPKQQ